MSLNRYEQALFDYWNLQPDERRHWQMKVSESLRPGVQPGNMAHALERDLCAYFAERSQIVAQLKALNDGSQRRVSFLSLAEHLIRLWGPPIKVKPRSVGQL